MNEDLSQIVADLVKSKGGEELSSKIHRLRDDIKIVIEGEDTILGKIRGLVESFREIIPDEKQRYNAALKALSTTSKLSRQEIVKAVNNQLEELKILEKGLLSGIPDWLDEIKVMQAASQEIRGEIAQLREQIVRLESDEKVIINSMAAREKEIKVVEKAMREVFTDIGADIAALKIKVEEAGVERMVVQPVLPVEHAADQPVPPRDSLKSDIPVETAVVAAQKSEIQEPAAPPDTELQKKCPMCGGRINYHINEDMWMCYTCAYEESGKGEVPGKREEKSEHTNAPDTAPASVPVHEPAPPLAVPLASMSSNEYQEPIKGSIPGSIQKSSPSNKQPPTKKKPCPVCRKKMLWYPDDKAWRCPACYYERRI